MSRFFEYIEERIRDIIGQRRMGFYSAMVSHALQTYRRAAVDAEWGPTLQRLRRISSPILDIIPARGTTMAVLSQDGVPEFGAIIGKLWDDDGVVADMTAWIRANLEEHPGHIELGAEQGVRIVVGENSVDIEPIDDGRVEIVADQVVLESSDCRIGSADADDPPCLTTPTTQEIDELWAALEGHTHEYTEPLEDSANPVPAQTSGGSASGSAGDIGADNVTVT